MTVKDEGAGKGEGEGEAKRHSVLGRMVQQPWIAEPLQFSLNTPP